MGGEVGVALKGPEGIPVEVEIYLDCINVDILVVILKGRRRKQNLIQ